MAPKRIVNKVEYLVLDGRLTYSREEGDRDDVDVGVGVVVVERWLKFHSNFFAQFICFSLNSPRMPAVSRRKEKTNKQSWSPQKINTPNCVGDYICSLNLPSFFLSFRSLLPVCFRAKREWESARAFRSHRKKYKTAKNGVEAKLIWFTNNVYKFDFIEYNLFDHFINLSVISINSGSQKSKRTNELTIEQQQKMVERETQARTHRHTICRSQN